MIWINKSVAMQVSIRSRLFEAGEPLRTHKIKRERLVSIRSRLFEAGELDRRRDRVRRRRFQSAPASLRRENFLLSVGEILEEVSIRSRLFEAGEQR